MSWQGKILRVNLNTPRDYARGAQYGMGEGLHW